MAPLPHCQALAAEKKHRTRFVAAGRCQTYFVWHTHVHTHTHGIQIISEDIWKATAFGSFTESTARRSMELHGSQGD